MDPAYVTRYFKPMCNFKYLYSGSDGFVSKCNGCGHIQVSFGGMVLTLTTHDFKVLCTITDFKCGKLQGPLYDNVKSVFIPTPCPAIYFFLTPHEAIGFRSILETADTEMKTHEMLGLFNQ
jgi:hypothetical protein